MSKENNQSHTESLPSTLSQRKLHRNLKWIAAGTAMNLANGVIWTGIAYKMSDGSFIPPWLSSSSSSAAASLLNGSIDGVFPGDPCSLEQPFQISNSGSQRETAEACERVEDGEIILVNFTSLDQKDAREVAGDAQQLFVESQRGSDDILDPKIIAIPASQRAKNILRRTTQKFIPKKGIPVPDAEDSPSEIAIKTMGILKRYPHALVASLSPQVGYQDAGVTYLPQGIATIYINELLNSGANRDQSIASDVVHEIGGHGFNLGHDSEILNDKETVSGDPENETDVFDFSDAVLNEYAGKDNLMGSWHAPERPQFNQIQLDELNFSKAILKGSDILRMRRLGSQFLMLKRRDIQGDFSTREKGLYVMTSLEDPIKIPTGTGTVIDKNPNYIQFNNVAIMPSSYSNPTGDGYYVNFLLFDSTNTHDTAYCAYPISIDSNKEYGKRIIIRTLAN